MNSTPLPLRDIHLPAPPGWWPPAPGWWLLLALTAILVALTTWLWRRRKHPPIQKIGLRELSKLENTHKTNPQHQVREISALMRRICISAFPRSDVAGLTGDAWLRFLDTQMGEHHFTDGPGRVLADAPYRPDAEVDVESLLRVCHDWLQQLPKMKR